jgi:hypothetical protein
VTQRVLQALLRYWVIVSTLAGCAVLPAPPTESSRQSWGHVAIVASPNAPKSNFRYFAAGKASGAVKGATVGTGLGVATAGAFAAMGTLESVVAPYLAVVSVPVMMVGGGYAGARSAISPDDAKAVEAVIENNLKTLKISDILAKAVHVMAANDARQQTTLLVDAGPDTPEANRDYRDRGPADIDVAAEISVTDAGFTGSKQMRFYMVANTHLVRVSDNARLYGRDFVYQSDEYDASQWARDKAALLRMELERAYASLSESMVEQIFLLTDLPVESRAAQDNKGGALDILGGRDACGVAWRSPPHDYHPAISDTSRRSWNRFPVVNTRSPVLEWESFPRADDHRADARGIILEIADVHYDLRVWKVDAGVPPVLVYERRDLRKASHTLETALQPASRYFWSVRARFELSGAPRATRWGYFRAPGYSTDGKTRPQVSPAAAVGLLTGAGGSRDPCTLDFIPTSNYYRFETPK